MYILFVNRKRPNIVLIASFLRHGNLFRYLTEEKEKKKEIGLFCQTYFANK